MCIAFATSSGQKVLHSAGNTNHGLVQAGPPVPTEPEAWCVLLLLRNPDLRHLNIFTGVLRGSSMSCANSEQ